MFRTTFDSEKREWSGANIESDWDPQSSLGIEILKSLELYGPRIAQICANTGTTKTFNELRTLTIRTAKNLRKFGCQRGREIFFIGENIAEMVPLAFAALCLGCPIAAEKKVATRSQCEYYLNATKPEFIFIGIKYYPLIKECLANLRINAKVFTIGGEDSDSIPISKLFECHDENDEEEPYFQAVTLNGVTETAFINRSTGSTGTPKCICLSHAVVLDKSKGYRQIYTPFDVYLGFTSLDVASGVRALVAGTLNGLTQIVNVGPFSPERFIEIVEKFQVTIAKANALMAIELLHYPEIASANLSSLKLFICGGAKIPLRTIQTLDKYFKNGRFVQNYGLNETVGSIALNLNHVENDSVGQLISGCQAKIVNDQGERFGVNEIGELCLKFPHPFLGYLHNFPDLKSCIDEEGFFKTGDLARFDASGDLFVIDRLKELFKSCSNVVTPSRIEGFLNTIDGVKASCVVPIPDGNGESLPAAFIIKTKNSTCTAQSIYDVVSKHLAFYELLRGGIHFVNAFPLAGISKIDRNSLKQMAIEHFNNQNNILN